MRVNCAKVVSVYVEGGGHAYSGENGTVIINDHEIALEEGLPDLFCETEFFAQQTGLDIESDELDTFITDLSQKIADHAKYAIRNFGEDCPGYRPATPEEILQTPPDIIRNETDTLWITDQTEFTV